jgi:hypothetical protein
MSFFCGYQNWQWLLACMEKARLLPLLLCEFATGADYMCTPASVSELLFLERHRNMMWMHWQCLSSTQQMSCLWLLACME